MTRLGAIRRENLIKLISLSGTAVALAEAVGSSGVYFSQVVRQETVKKTGKPRELGPQLARRIEQKLKLPEGWMDAPHYSSEPSTTEHRTEERQPPAIGSMSSAEVDMVLAVRRLSPAHRNKFIADAMFAAEQAENIAGSALGRLGLPTAPMPDSHTSKYLPGSPAGPAPDTTPGALSPPEHTERKE